MLLNTFFEIKNIRKGEDVEVDIQLNPNHPVYKGHFKSQPVAPGVCLTQMFKEVLGELVGKPLQLVTGNNLKFTAVLDPNVHPNVCFKLTYTEEEGVVKAKGNLVFEDQKFFAIQGGFKVK